MNKQIFHFFKTCCPGHFSFTVVAMLLVTSQSTAADLIRILPVTNNILQLHFDEGHLDYQGEGQNRFDGIRLYYRLLDIQKAVKPSSYFITSPDDPQYRTSLRPLAVGRKSKGAEFNNLYDAGEPSHLSDHFIYLELPFAMISGKTYTVQLNGLADNRKTFTFVFDERKIRSETIHVNQLGFSPDAKKYTYLSHWMGDFDNGTHTDGGLNLDAWAGARFHLLDAKTGDSVFTGTIEKRKEKSSREAVSEDYGPTGNFTKADVWQCDFSGFSRPGTYVLAVERIGCSYPFEIRPDIYREAYAFASHALFCQRAGIEKEVEPGWVFERDYHPDNGTQIFYYDKNLVTGKHKIQGFRFGQEVTGIWGWYHDAGDWDHYPHHVRVPATLLHLYDLRAEYFTDGDVSNRYKNDPATDWIEEGKNGLPDLLDEAGWLVHFLRRARHALLEQGLGTGGVPGYVGRDAGFESLPSWKDTRDVAVTGEHPSSTFDYAGLAARYARCLQRFKKLGGTVEQTTIDDWLREAREAYAWAEANGGEKNSRAFAAAALYLAGGEEVYQTVFKNNYEKVSMPAWAGTSMQEFANLLFAVIPAGHPGLDVALQNRVRQDLLEAFSPNLVDYSEQNRGYRWSSLATGQPNRLGAFSTPRTTWAATAHYFTGEQKYLDAIRSAADYFLGGNEMNLVWMNGFGDYSEQSVFHLNSWYSKDYNSMVYRNPILPGLVPYGIMHNCDWQAGCDFKYVGDEDFSRSTAYPHVDRWPQSETRFQNRHSIAGSEFTIHQTQVEAIFTLGYLCEKPATRLRNTLPELTLQLREGQAVDMAKPLLLTVDASPGTRRVAYFYDWHFIGESFDSEKNFAYDWNLLETNLPGLTETLITAVGYDEKGRSTLPSPQGERKIKLTWSGNALLGEQWGVLDIPFRLDATPKQPFDVAFSAVLEHESGERLEVPGFFNGGNTYLLRVSLPLEGRWTYTTASSLPKLAGRQGELLLGPNRKPSQHGPVTVSKKDPQLFEYADGSPYFLLAFELDWLFALDYGNPQGIPKTESIISDVAAHGFNQVVMNVYAYDPPWGREEISPETNFAKPRAFPFGGTNEAPEHGTLNVDFFQHLDRVVAHLNEKEIVAHLMVYVWNKKVNWPEAGSPADNRYFDYVVKRYQAFPNIIWDISKEALGYGHDDMDYITERIDRLRKLDGHRRLLSVHDYQYCSAFPQKVDFISIQQWVPNLYDEMLRAKQKHPDKPVFNIEHGGYEKTMHTVFDGAYTDPLVCLDRNYQCVFAGVYSTYYWQNSSWYEVVWKPFELPEAQQPHFRYYHYLARLFAKYPLNGMQPAQFGFSTYCLTDHRKTYLFYLPQGMLKVVGDNAELAGKKIRLTWFDPLNGEFSPVETRTMKGAWMSFARPAGWESPIAVLVVEVDN